MLKLDLEKAEEPRIKLPTSAGSSKQQESSRKTSTSALLTMPKPFTGWITTNCGKLLKRWEYQTTWPASWEICLQVKKYQLEPDVKNGLVPNWERSTTGCIMSPCLFNLYAEYMMLNARQNGRMATGIKIAGRNINNLRHADDTTLMAEIKE